ncbi:hypothetical protein PFFCH_00368 [Plasmodium falciparum FCH/4]|uniref:Uncharacterized protein n=1 Tax=Plasmodium falciparum FCH/4 TaxID=1036724 RepID=A0A024VUP3_PLAFA|nr:hypothetical protein PFFCH_00368 [Plasmodium falciparum FCH/4]
MDNFKIDLDFYQVHNSLICIVDELFILHNLQGEEIFAKKEKKAKKNICKRKVIIKEEQKMKGEKEKEEKTEKKENMTEKKENMTE